MARHVVTTQNRCPQCAQTAVRTHVADSGADWFRSSASVVCEACGLAEESDGAELTDDARDAFCAAEGRWRGVARDFAGREAQVLKVMRRFRDDPPRQLMTLLREGRPIVEGALVKVERMDAGAKLEVIRL